MRTVSLSLSFAVAIVTAILHAPVAMAKPVSLASTITKLSPDPMVVLTEASAGPTPLSRYRAGHQGDYKAKVPLVLLIQVGPVNSPDTVAVTKATRDGKHIRVELEVRRFSGPLTKNIVTSPLVEIDVGALGKGEYDIEIAESELSFDNWDHPEAAKTTHSGNIGSMEFDVR
jgi:hypothetical protein